MSSIKRQKEMGETKIKSTRKITPKARKTKGKLKPIKAKTVIRAKIAIPDPESFESAFSLISEPNTGVIKRKPGKPLIPYTKAGNRTRQFRMAIWNYTGGHCSYCGKPITLEEMQIDHVKPLCRNVRHIPGIENHPHYKDRIGNNTQDNLRASCPKCNRWKAQMTLEEFRKVFEKQYKNLSRTNSAFKLLYDYGLISVTNNFKVKFFFEKII